jgi:hypothetical protein
LGDGRPYRLGQAETGRLDGEGVRVDAGDERVAVDVGVRRPGLFDFGDRADPSDHSRRGQGQLGGVAGERLAVRHRQQVCPEPVDLGKQAGLRGGGQAENGDDRSDADRDAERGEARSQTAGAQPDAGHPRDVGRLQPGQSKTCIRAHGEEAGLLTSANAVCCRLPATLAVTT